MQPDTAKPPPADAALEACLLDPFASIEDVVTGLSRLEETLYARKDRRAVFASAYLSMTQEVGRRVGQQQYNDPQWVARYAIAFANLYRRALLAFVRGELAAVPAPWLTSFQTSQSGANLLVQDLLLGVNAHINNDLAIALDEVSIDPGRDARREDHFAVNEAIRGATDAVQDRVGRLYAPVFGLLDRFLGNYDEHTASFSVEKARLNAWVSAVSLVSAASGPERQAAIQSISDRANVIARLILLPTRHSRVLKLRRIFERATFRWQLIRPGF
jgi:hypothetical protein